MNLSQHYGKSAKPTDVSIIFSALGHGIPRVSYESTTILNHHPDFSRIRKYSAADWRASRWLEANGTEALRYVL